MKTQHFPLSGADAIRAVLVSALCLPVVTGLAADSAPTTKAAPTNEPAIKAAPVALVQPATKVVTTNSTAKATVMPTTKATANAVSAGSKAAATAPSSDSAAKSKLAAAVVAAKAKGTGTGPTSRVDFNSFKIVVENNIFNPNRRYRPNIPTEVPPVVRVDAFALVGVMSYEKGQFAFFDGTSSQYKKAAKAGDKIGEYTVSEIGSKQVKLKTETQEMDFPLGKQMRRVEGGEWKMSDSTGSFTSSGGYSGSSSSSGSFNRDSRDSRGGDRSSRFSSGFGSRGTGAPTTPGAPVDAGANAAPADAAPAPSDTTINDSDDLLTRLRKKRDAEMNKQ